jgi:hypothetical protein
MNSKTIGLILAVLALAAFALAVFLFRDRDAGPVVQLPEVKANTATGLTAVEPRSESIDSKTVVTGGEPADDVESLEQAFADDHSLLSARHAEVRNDDTFIDLLARLREDDSAIAADKRRTYELFFYSQPLIRSAAITLDTLECGTRFCVAQLRANDDAVLKRFSENLMASSDFQAGATMIIVGEPGAAGVTHRLLFSHDPAINSITLPPGTVLPEAFETADNPPDIH